MTFQQKSYSPAIGGYDNASNRNRLESGQIDLQEPLENTLTGRGKPKGPSTKKYAHNRMRHNKTSNQFYKNLKDVQNLLTAIQNHTHIQVQV